MEGRSPAYHLRTPLDDGKRVLITARGDVFSVPVKDGAVAI